ncbi:1,2-phenylacetyl-CoA epoxidase subunit PaaC [Alcaligenes sp. SDU_A2]|uniref:1,2-phenylacetyl-CoA epoxidase subunit PaaC n=1 Tax=Alcaligenes sp. SDU_A2 TaxID=3136634 RepID=UPI002C7E7D00|nr:phenylacetate-CoA oxygenase subunit PaaC [Alcaligenes sp.]HRL27294.1 phenylacetate-CoA oxygenase subunit PaaC [Alcaligenes sp.]
MDKALFSFALRLGDSTLVLSQRLGEWTGHGPALEEELASANTALDLLGQARMWLTLAGETEGQGRDEDRLAYHRDAHEYTNYLLVERDNGHYGQTLMRQFLFDSWHFFLLEELVNSSDEQIRAIAQKAHKEVMYHVRRSSDLIVRLGDGTPESHARMQGALDDAWRFVGELFLDDEVTQTLAQRQAVPLLASLWTPWLDYVGEVFERATLRRPAEQEAQHKAYRGGPQGRHTEALGYLLAEMQHLPRMYPDARW